VAPRDGASDLLADRLKLLAAHLLEADPEDLELRDGEAVVRGAPGQGVAFEEIARLAYLETHRLPEGVEPGRECTASFDPPGYVLQRLPRRARDGLPRADRMGDPADRDPPPRDAVAVLGDRREGDGEGGTMGAPACIATAVTDALAHLGAEVDRIPITPDSLHEALREREQA
jgi:CO/xanthine dehydrogenase Mo-binding subunit